MSKFIVYVGNDEVLVTTKKLESDAIKEWFTDGGRDIEWYERIDVFHEKRQLLSPIE